MILDVYDNKTKGIFTILNDECAFSSIENFANKLKNAWLRDKTSPISWDTQSQKSKESVFMIRHFANDVTYTTVCPILLFIPMLTPQTQFIVFIYTMIWFHQDDFVDKNRKNIPNTIRLMIEKSTALLEVPNIEPKPARPLKTLASSLKFEIDNLMKSLKGTVSNEFQQNEKFKIYL